MVIDTDVAFPAESAARRRIDAATRAEDNLYVDAQGLSERLFGDHLPANMLLVGAAYQHGCLPLSARAIERAIELNGAAVEKNLAAFRWGRAYVARPAKVPGAEVSAPAAPSEEAAAIVARVGATGELRRLLDTRVSELIAYQNRAYAETYADRVAAVAQLSRARAGDSADRIAEEYARALHKLMTYKDEYEVARLHLDGVERARLRRAFGPDARVRILLHPPALRALGLKRKLRFGPWIFPFLRVLRSGRRFRGSALDPFGYAHVRRVERALIGEYDQLIDDALDAVTPATAAALVELAALPDVIRGYEQVKLAGVERFRREAAELVGALHGGHEVAAAATTA